MESAAPPLRRRNIVVTVLALGLMLLAVSGVLDGYGERYTDSSFRRALLTFGVTRGLNAVISVAQGTELAMEPAGIGVIFTPGQILDPVNDLVERFSWVMLASSTSLGVQSLLLKIFSSSGFTVALLVCLAAALTVLWWPQPPPAGIRAVILRLAMIMLVLRFLIPVMAIANEAVYNGFLAPEYEASSRELEAARQAIGVFNEQTRGEVLSPGGQQSWLENLRGRVDSVLESMDMDKQLQALRVATEKLTEHTVNLIVVFSVETILFPLLFLWLVIRGSRHLLSLTP